MNMNILSVANSRWPFMGLLSQQDTGSEHLIYLTFVCLPGACGSLASDGIKLNMIWMEKVKICNT